MDVGILEGKVAIVTGASRGIGAAIAKRFGAEGAAVAVAARTTEPGQSPLAGHDRRDGGGDQRRRRHRGGDTRRPVQARGPGAPGRRDHPAARRARHPGQQRGGDATSCRVADFTAKPLRAHVRGAGRGAVRARPAGAARDAGARPRLDPEHLLDRRRAHPAMPPGRFASGGTVYGMCKAALERFSTGLAAELYHDNIAVNALSPTRVVPTPGHDLPPPDHRGRPQRRAARGDGRGRADALPRRAADA